MKELSPTARALLEAGREAEESPNAHDRARVQARLTALLGASAFGAAASQAAAMASLASGTTAAGSGSAGAAAASATGVGASAANAGAVGAGAIGAAGAATLGTGAAVSGAATAGVGSAGVAAGGGAAAATGWVATLGAKGIAWISAAALSAAVGTTAVVTRQSDETALDARVVAAARSGKPASEPAQPTSDIAAATALSEQAAEPSGTEPAAAQDATNAIGPNVTGSVTGLDSQRVPAARSSESAASPMDGRKREAAARAQRVASSSAVKPVSAAAPSNESGISATRFAALAASASDVRRAQPSSAPVANARGQEGESDAELLPQPTDPDQMNAVAAAPRDEVRAPQLPATDATTPSHALNPGVTPAGVQTKPVAATSGDDDVSSVPSTQDRQESTQPQVALSGELQLLAQAQRALHDGKLSLALTLLDQHSSQHAQGALREERLAARAVVLCRMHQSAAGNVEAQRLAAATPRSPLLPWVRSACNKR